MIIIIFIFLISIHCTKIKDKKLNLLKKIIKTIYKINENINHNNFYTYV